MTKTSLHARSCFEIEINYKWLQLRARKVSGAFEEQATAPEMQTSLFSLTDANSPRLLEAIAEVRL